LDTILKKAPVYFVDKIVLRGTSKLKTVLICLVFGYSNQTGTNRQPGFQISVQTSHGNISTLSNHKIICQNQTNLMVKIISGKGDDARSGIEREGVHAPVGYEGVRDRAGGRAPVKIRGLDSTDDGPAFGVLVNVEWKSRSFKRWGVVVDVLDLEQMRV